jgi:hypothetical protein
MRVWGAFAALALTLALGAQGASALTERLGATSFPDSGEAGGCETNKAGATSSFTFALINVPEGINGAASADGRVTSWRVRGREGGGTFRLVVLRPNKDGSYTAAGLSEPATDVAGNANATSLPIKAGEYIGATASCEGASSFADIFGSKSATFAALFPGFSELEQTLMPKLLTGSLPTEFGADVVLAPQPASISPVTGPAAGGTVVTIRGRFLTGATQVLFGSKPAKGVASEEIETLTATAPAGTAGSTVDVRVVGPGGTSPASAAMRFTYAATVVPQAPGKPSAPGAPTMSALAETNAIFAVGHGSTPLTGVTALRHPRGTVFSFSLDHAATVTVTIRRARPGRLAGRACVAPKRKLAGRPKCTRYATAATLRRSARAGADKLPFSGRVSGRALSPGRYEARFVATDVAGASSPATLRFTISAR